MATKYHKESLPCLPHASKDLVGCHDVHSHQAIRRFQESPLEWIQKKPSIRLGLSLPIGDKEASHIYQWRHIPPLSVGP